MVPCIFSHSNKTPNKMQKTIVKFITLSYRHCSTCFGPYNAHHQEPVKLPLQPLVSVWMWSPSSGLLMMGIVTETCWAVSVRQSNKHFYDWLLHLVGCFIWVNFDSCKSLDLVYQCSCGTCYGLEGALSLLENACYSTAFWWNTRVFRYMTL